jgi:hypothetical protein
MAAPRKYPEELRQRPVKMVSEVRERDGKGVTTSSGRCRTAGCLSCTDF